MRECTGMLKAEVNGRRNHAPPHKPPSCSAQPLAHPSPKGEGSGAGDPRKPSPRVRDPPCSSLLSAFILTSREQGWVKQE